MKPDLHELQQFGSNLLHSITHPAQNATVEAEEEQGSLLVFTPSGGIDWENSRLTDEEIRKVSRGSMNIFTLKSRREQLEDEGYYGIPIKKHKRSHHSAFAGSKVAMEANAGDMAPEFKKFREEHIKNDPLVIEHFAGALCPIPDMMRLGSGHDMAGNPLNDDEIFLATVGTAGAVLGAAGALDVPGTGMLDEVGEATDAGRTMARVEGEVSLVAEITADEEKLLKSIGRGGLANHAIAGKTSASEFDTLAQQLKDLKGTKIKPGEQPIGAGNYFDPDTNTIYLNANGKKQRRGMLYEEIQHALDHGGVYEDIRKTGLSNDKLHTETFQRMVANPWFNVSDEQAPVLLNLADILWRRNW